MPRFEFVQSHHRSRAAATSSVDRLARIDELAGVTRNPEQLTVVCPTPGAKNNNVKHTEWFNNEPNTAFRSSPHRTQVGPLTMPVWILKEHSPREARG